MNDTVSNISWDNRDPLELIDRKKIWIMVCRALNMVDKRLVDHGIRVALVLFDMLWAEGRLSETDCRKLGVMALFHDIGAYRTDEIDRMLEFETDDVWEHAICGYLILKPFFSHEIFTRILLYHHARYDIQWDEDKTILHYAQLMYIADRVCIWHDEMMGSREELDEHLEKCSGTIFSPEGIALFRKADRQYGTWEKLRAEQSSEQLVSAIPFPEEEMITYLYILVEAIDFRSRETALHTRGLMEIALELARCMGMSEEIQQKVYYGSLLHDLGKIGMPLSILEKPGRLTPEEMQIMRKHVVITEQIIAGCIEEETAQICLRHHERLDGSGYPRGLTGAELTAPQRLVAVADVLSALCMKRSYKCAFTKEKCLSILWEMAERGQLDRDIVSLAAKEFDRIIDITMERCKEVENNYLEMQEQFQELMQKYDPGEKYSAIG